MNYKKLFIVTITILIIFVFAFIIFPLSCGYTIGFLNGYQFDLENIYFIFSIIGACIVPIAVVYLQRIISRDKSDISTANIDLFKELEEVKREFQEKLILVSDSKPQVPTKKPTVEEQNKILKEKALKLINIAMMMKTKPIADELNLSLEETFVLLNEMVMHDKMISCAGQLHISNIDNILWTKKRSS